VFNPEMSYRSLGKSGLKVSTFSLGGWTTFGGSVTDTDLVKKIHRRAYEAGINFFDNADIYAKGESEKIVGLALKEFPRHELVISSKVFWPMSEDINDKGLSRKHIMESVRASLKRMGTDYLDLYFCHRFDPGTPLLETIRAMDDLIRQGHILYWGTSEWTGDQLREAHKICQDGGYYKPQVEQPQYNLMVRSKFEQDVAPAARELGMGLVTWSPMASGFLSGKYDKPGEEGRLNKMNWLKNEYLTPANHEKMMQFKKLSEQKGVERGQIAIAWVAQHPDVSSVILGVTELEQLEKNLKAMRVTLSASEDRSLKGLFR
jgi:voltage-dependent potassium channel beta subunit